ncbi:MAG: pyridoxal-phosphate dependent enzyme [Desulfovibrio sp.]|uniref:threonine ammonia-lyase n=1 Tax=Desulfovibrio sp. TaxID=885 RepID=UPI0039E39943
MREDISLNAVFAAEKVVYAALKPTQLTMYPSLSRLIGGQVYIKHENQHPGGSFKIRGGINLMHHLKQEGVKGVITFSTGNHGISIASAAQRYSIDATIVVPKNSNLVKIQSMREVGATVLEEGENFEAAAAFGLEYQKKYGLRFVHAANEPHIINGVGTEFTEILRDLPDVDAIVLPLGGGSEAAAAVTVFKQINPAIEIYAVQAAASQAAYLSWKRGELCKSENRTFAGGFATGEGFALPFGIYKDQLADFVLLGEDEILQGIQLAMHHTRNMAEGAGASTIMAAIKLKDRLQGKKVVLQMSGANETIDVIRKSLSTPASA